MYFVTFQTPPTNHREQCHSHRHTVKCLHEILGLRHGIDFRRDLVDPRQGVHDDHVVRPLGNQFRVDQVLAGHLLVLDRVRKTFFLDTRDIEDVGFSITFSGEWQAVPN